MVEEVEAKLKKKPSQVFKVTDQALTYTRSREVCTSDPRRKEVIQDSLLERNIHSWRGVLTWNCLLEMVS